MTGPATTDAAGQFERLGMGISEIFDRGGLPAASAAMKEWTQSQKLNEKQSLTAYKEMDTLREQVRGYAQDLGVTLVDAQAEYNFLLQDTTYQTTVAKIKQDELNQSIRDSIRGFIDTNSPLQQNERNVIAWAKATAKYNDIAGDSWKDYMKEFEETGFSTGYYNSAIKNQLRAATDYATNLGKAKGLLNESAFNALVAQGKDGADLAAAISTMSEGSKELKDIQTSLLTGADGGGSAGQIAAMFDPKAVAAAIRTKYGEGKYAETIIRDMFAENISTTEAMEKLGVGVTELVATAAAERPTELTAKWGDTVAEDLRKQLVDGINNPAITLTAKKDGGTVSTIPGSTYSGGRGGSGIYPKDGGLIRRFKDGTRGGTISGVGGPRADNIPAMLSVGEFVVNAAATRRNERLLSAINSGNASDLMADAISSGASGSGTNIGITVNAAPGMNTDEIVSEVERRLAFSYRKGTR